MKEQDLKRYIWEQTWLAGSYTWRRKKCILKHFGVNLIEIKHLLQDIFDSVSEEDSGKQTGLIRRSVLSYETMHFSESILASFL